MLSVPQTYVLAVCLAVGSAPAQTSPRETVERVVDVSVSRSSSGRFLVFGKVSIDRFAITRWAEDLTERLERTTGLTVPLSPSDPVQISIRESEREEGYAMIEPHGTGPVLVILNHPKVHAEQAQEVFCRLMLGFCLQTRTKERDRPGGGEIPWWLSEGVSQNLFGGLRARNSAEVSAAWQEARLPPLREIIRKRDPDLGRNRDDLLFIALSGSLMGWLLSGSEPSQGIEPLFAALAAGRDVTPATLAEAAPQCASLNQLDAQWDRWLLRQRRFVFDPGKSTSLSLDQLKAQILLYPGTSGIPFVENRLRRRDFRGLLDVRDAPWFSAFVQAKRQSLRVLAVGRGAEFGSVVDLYCRFLDALEDPEQQEDTLREMLADAETALKSLEAATDHGMDGQHDEHP